MNCFLCDGPRVAPVRNVSHYQLVSHPIGAMSLERRFDGQPMIKVEIETDFTFDVCIGESDCDSIETYGTAAGQIENVKYCPFCGKRFADD